MIAADTSSIAAYFAGSNGPDVSAVRAGLESKILVLPPVVLTDLLSYSTLPRKLKNYLTTIPLLPIVDGYWERAGISRAKLKKKKLKAKVADSLIAQSCLDHSITLITRDSDFRHYNEQCGLKIL